MWPFNIFALRRAAEEAKRRAEHDTAMLRLKESLDAAERRRQQFQSKVAQGYGSAAATQRAATLRAVPSSTLSSPFDDPLSPLNPLSPLSPAQQFSTWAVPAEEPRHSSSHCNNSVSSHSHDYGIGSSHSHSSHDHGCSSSSYDSSSSSTYDSGSSSSSNDW